VTGAVLAALRAAALDAPDVRRPLDHVQGDASLAIDHIDFPRLAGRTSKNMRVPRTASTSSCRKPWRHRRPAHAPRPRLQDQRLMATTGHLS
jgi:hypothetical protein